MHRLFSGVGVWEWGQIPCIPMKLQSSYSRTEECLFQILLWKKIIHKSQSATAVQSNSYMSLACSVSSGFTSFLNWKKQNQTLNPKQTKNPKQNRMKACGNNSPNNNSGLALVARKDICEVLQSSHRWLETGSGTAPWGDSTRGLLHPASPHPFQPSLSLSGVALNCFPPPGCGRALDPSREWPEGRPRNEGEKDTE